MKRLLLPVCVLVACLIATPAHAASLPRSLSRGPVIILVSGYSNTTKGTTPGYDGYADDELWGSKGKRGMFDVLSPWYHVEKAPAAKVDKRGVINPCGDIGKNAQRLYEYIVDLEVKHPEYRSRKYIWVGYSMGGLIIRAHLDKHPNSSMTKRTLGVVQVGTPNKGSEWAGWFGHDTASIEMGPLHMGDQSTKHTFNSTYMNAAKRKYFRLAGNFWYGISDFVVTVDSVRGPKSLWVPNKDPDILAGGVHNQMVQDGLGGTCIIPHQRTGDANWPEAHRDDFARQIVKRIDELAGYKTWDKIRTLSAAAASGETVAAGIGYPAQAAADATSSGDAAVVGASVVASKDILVPAAGASQLPFTPRGPGRGMLVPAAGASQLSFTLRGPGITIGVSRPNTVTGVRLTGQGGDVPLVKGGTPEGAADVYAGENVAPGPYTLTLDGGLSASAVRIVVDEQCDPKLAVSVPLYDRTGTSFVATAAAMYSGSPVLGVSMTCALGTGSPVPMHDDGATPDAVAGDGVYSTTLRAPDATGTIDLVVESSGQIAGAGSFQRTSRASLMVFAPSAAFEGPLTPACVRTADGMVDALTVSGKVRSLSSTDETFSVGADLLDQTGKIVAQPTTDVLVPAGQVKDVSAVISSQVVYPALTGDATLTVGQVRLSGLQSDTLVQFDSVTPSTTLLPIARGSLRYSSCLLLVSGSNPTSSAAVTLAGGAATTELGIAGVDISLDDGSTWMAATPSDGAFDSKAEDFNIPLQLPEGVTSVLARPRRTDGSVWETDTCGGLPVMVDTTPPEVLTDVASSYFRRATFTLTATDTVSGPQDMFWRLDGGPWKSAGEMISEPVQVDVTGFGAHTIEYYAVDRVGNRSGSITRSFTINSASVGRVYGGDRYLGAIQFSRSVFPNNSCGSVVLANGDNYSDMGPGVGLAGAVYGPLLLCSSTSVSAATLDEMKRVGTTCCWIIGGTGSVSEAVANAVRARGIYVNRTAAGATRYDVSYLVAKNVAAVRSWSTAPPSAKIAIVVKGTDYPDMLAASGVAAQKGIPILLTAPTALTPQTANAIRGFGVNRVIIVGGLASVSQAVENSLRGICPSVERVGGADRYEVTANLADLAVREGWAQPVSVSVATGDNFTDGMPAASAAARKGGVLLLTGTTYLQPPTQWWIEDHIETVKDVTVYGGPASVNDAVLQGFRNVVTELPTD